MQVVDALHHAGTDKRVQGLVACIGRHSRSEGLAELQELRNAVHDLQVTCWLLCILTVASAYKSKMLKFSRPSQSCLPRAFFVSFCMHSSRSVVSQYDGHMQPMGFETPIKTSVGCGEVVKMHCVMRSRLLQEACCLCSGV